jgi:small basic protein
VDQKVTINRSLVGWLALGFLVGAVIAFATEESDTANLALSICARVGVVLGTMWMALPKDGTLGKWAEVSIAKLVVIVVIFVTVVRTPKKFLPYLPILLAVAAAGRFLRPRDKVRPPRNVG